MCVIVLTHVQPPGEARRQPSDHNPYLDRDQQAGQFTASGPQRPRTGGVISAGPAGPAEVHATVAEEPFLRAGAPEHRVIEFMPGKHAAGSGASR